MASQPLIRFDEAVKRVLFITGTDTGVGKTVLTCLLTRHLLATGKMVAALKPFSSGGREDAEALSRVQGNRLKLDEINPWFFKAPLAPLVAARQAHRKIRMAEVLAHVTKIQQRFSIVVIEGAGGLLSPLGENFDAADLIRELRAAAIVVCPNRLGAINQTLLLMKALPEQTARHAQVVLVDSRSPDASHISNLRILKEFLGEERVHKMPRLSRRCSPQPAVQRTLDALVANLIPLHENTT